MHAPNQPCAGTKRFATSVAVAGLTLATAVLVGCEPPASTPPTAEHSHTSTDTRAPVPTNRIDIPPAVRGNLGVTFATVERRNVESTLRLPGSFETIPSARRDYATAMAGRVQLLVKQFEAVSAGTPLYRLDAPQWREVQQSIATAAATLQQARATVDAMAPIQAAHHRHEATLQASVDLWTVRLEELDAIRQAGGGRLGDRNAARASLALAKAELADVQERDAELVAEQISAEANLGAARADLDLCLNAAAALLDMSTDTIKALVPTTEGPQPRWRLIETIEVQALRSGVVSVLDATDGSWVDAHATVLQVVDPDALRFHAVGLQSDLDVLRDGLPARIINPDSAGPTTDTPMSGPLQLGLGGDASDRTINVFVTPDGLASWARPGVSAQLEVVTDSSSTSELAIPLSAVQKDGLQRVIFRRDPNNPDVAIRVDADLGRNDGRWVEVLSGLADGDEVVLDGGFQLMLATSTGGGHAKGGHFHADGTWHEGEH
ncbi:MAG: HlyD family efflux transporter periplasmic adaptor subunit [Phycisphaerales bacterium]|nr:HlyD family efflux transporter periplasmic adaptor subunit [Phycisphaerales bacterium]